MHIHSSVQTYAQKLGSTFSLFTAFSRENPGKKIYVQERIKEQATLINDLLLQKGHFYVCGDAANMAREVNALLGQIIGEQRGIGTEKGDQVVKQMRAGNLYQEDVWS